MGFRRRHRILSAGKSPSRMVMERTYKRAQLNGGVTQDFSANVENIREISRKLNYDILSDASFVYVPASYGEGKNFTEVHNIRNLLQWSEDFTQSIWTKSGGTAIVSNTTTAPDGTLTADVLRQNGAPSTFTRRLTATVSLSGMYTLSIYAKKKEFDNITLVLFNNSTNAVRFDLTTGIVAGTSGSINSYNIKSLQDGWFRCSMSSNLSGIVRADYILADASGNVIFNDNNTFGLYVWGAQLEQGAHATPYQKTVAAGNGIVDFNFTRATSATVTNKIGVIEDSCYNLLQQSEDFSNASWSKALLLFTTNAEFAPNNTISADKVFESTTTGTHRFNAPSYIPIPLTQYTVSIYVKPAGRTRFNINHSDGVSPFTVQFNLNTLTTSMPSSSTITDVGLGWFRCTVTRTMGSTIGSGILQFTFINDSGSSNYLGDGVSGFYIWGAQAVQGSTPRPYLRTTNRNAVPKISYQRSLLEPSLHIEAAATNLLLNSTTGTTQNVTVTAQAYTLSLYGTGTYTLSGAFVGSLVGTGTNDRVTLTFTPTAGTLTLTVSGSITKVQLETGSIATTWITTVAATATRNIETSYTDLFNNNLLNQDNFTLFVEGYLFASATTNLMVGLSTTTATGARANDIGFFDGVRATYAVSSSVTSDTVNLSANTTFKFTIQRNGTSVKFFRNGAQIWTTQTITSINYRYLVVNSGGSNYMIDKIMLFNRTLTDAENILLTT